MVLQHFAVQDFDDKVTIVRDYLRQLREQKAFVKAYLRIK
jgi:hypothetical protein